MPAAADQPSLVELAEQQEVYDILLDHGLRGVRVQLVLRAVLAAFLVLVVIFVPPARYQGACYVVAGCYVVWAAAVTWLAYRGGERAVRLVWLALFGDVVALALVTLFASHSEQSWTADLVVNGFFLIPMLAATQLRPWVCAVVTIPTVAVYFAASAAARSANGSEPWPSIVLRTGALAGLALGCVLLSRVQRSRVATIGALAVERSTLLAETMEIEDRERRTLAENLHDGALQYVLAARQDLEDARESGDPESFDRLEHALRESSQLLRSAMTELHPAVLEQAGLVRALRELANLSAARGGFTVEVRAPGWDEDLRTTADPMLFATARELLTNVVKHADASAVLVTLGRHDGLAVLTVTDDGLGIEDGAMDAQLRAGHIGLASRRVRIEAAHGRLVHRRGAPRGTVAVVELPATVVD